MNRFYYLIFLFAISSCLSEENADPAKPSSFLRYYSNGNSELAIVAEETNDDGIIILSTTSIAVKDQLEPAYKIKLIKTDAYGNTVWNKSYPTANTTSLKASALLVLADGGFIVVGESLKNDSTNFAVIEVDAKGDSVRQKTVEFASGFAVSGKSIISNSDTTYLALASIAIAGKNIILTELRKKDFSPKWAKTFGTGESTLASKIFIDDFDRVFWSGSVKNENGSSDIRLTKAIQDSQLSLFDYDFGKSGFEDQGNDICRNGSGFAMVGSTNDKNGVTGDQDILLKVVLQDGTEKFSKTFSKYSDTDTGNSVCLASDGLLVLGTVRAGDDGFGGDDYFLMKYNGATGDDLWPAPLIFGNSGNDNGASVRQLSDGSLLILGTTEFAGRNSIMLMKTNKDGKME